MTHALRRSLPFWWPAVPILLGLVAGGWRVAVRVQAHFDADARQDERIAVLERIIVAEFPAYSPAIYYQGGGR